MKEQEHQELKDRLDRRYTKAVQAGFSFTGVFFGILISFAISGLVIAEQAVKGLDFTQVINPFSFGGFGTIGLAAMAGMIMVVYQMGQNEKKKIQSASEHKTGVDNLFFAYPALETHAPQEFKHDYNPKKFTFEN
jgi:hypothetical protein